MYAVVEFLNGENESTGQISIVPLIWIHKNDKKCYWPIRTNKVSFEDFVKKLTPFKKSWPAYKIKIHSRTASYSVAEKTLKNLLSNYPESSDSTRSFTQKNVEFSDNESSDSDGNELPKNVHQKETVTVRNEINCTDTLENETITGDTGSPGSISNETLSFQRHTEFETTVLNLLSQMAVNINQHSILLNEINRHTSAINADKLVEPKNLPKFPITSVEEFKKFEEEILNDSSLREYMVKRWAALGGTCPENLTRRILKQLITNEVATSYNWKGRDKNSFEKMTTIMDTIYAAVKHTFAAGEINELKIANSVKDWLKYAKLRMGKQKTLKTTFSCDGRPSGYYADVSTGCQVYHMCDGIGRQFSYTCPNATLFQQRMLICDHWYMVNCTRAEEDYSANLLIGQQRPFVEDLQYHRTPRPDILSATRNETEAHIIYRTGRNQMPGHVVGIESKIGELTSENGTEYFPPSHWATRNNPNFERKSNDQSRYANNNDNRRDGSKAIRTNSVVNRHENHFEDGKNTVKLNFKETGPTGTKTAKGNGQQNVVFGSNFKATTPVYPSSVEPTSEEPSESGVSPPDNGNSNLNSVVNFASNFRATTPVYPTSVDISSENPNSIGLLPPGNRDNETPNIPINFSSNFKATTPVFPESFQSSGVVNSELLPPVEAVPPAALHINFESNFKATTPVYPPTVEATSLNPDDVGLVAPKENSMSSINFESNYKATTPVYPKQVDSTSPNPNDIGLVAPRQNLPQLVNFESNFKATTPVYPKSIDVISEDPSEAGLLPPQENYNKSEITGNNIPNVLLEILPPKFDENYKTNNDPNIQTTVSPPSKFYQAPKLDPDFTIAEVETNDQLGIRINNFMKSLTGSQWHNLREEFKIPEYDFPLEENGRPSYEGTLNSFEAKQVKKKK